MHFRDECCNGSLLSFLLFLPHLKHPVLFFALRENISLAQNHKTTTAWTVSSLVVRILISNDHSFVKVIKNLSESSNLVGGGESPVISILALPWFLSFAFFFLFSLLFFFADSGYQPLDHTTGQEHFKEKFAEVAVKMAARCYTMPCIRMILMSQTLSEIRHEKLTQKGQHNQIQSSSPTATETARWWCSHTHCPFHSPEAWQFLGASLRKRLPFGFPSPPQPLLFILSSDLKCPQVLFTIARIILFSEIPPLKTPISLLHSRQ